jgi:hypothetical protein
MLAAPSPAPRFPLIRSRKRAVALGSAVVSTAVFGVPPKISHFRELRGWCSKIAEVLLAQLSLPQNRAKCSSWNVARVHGHVSLAAISVPQDDMRSRLAPYDETGTLQFCENLTCFVRHRPGCPRWKKEFRTGLLKARPAPFFQRATRGPNQTPLAAHPRSPNRAWSTQDWGRAHKNSPQESPCLELSRIKFRNS